MKQQRCRREVLSMSLSRLDLNTVHHPTVIDEFNKRANDFQLRIADQITRFAGSMRFVYLHIVLFTVWMVAVESIIAQRPKPSVDAPVIGRLNRRWA
jgi:uncharacterized membrane protein